MNKFTRSLIGAAFVALAATPSFAETPKDSLVMAWQFDDIISLDPAEIFEVSGAEYGAQVYDRLIGIDLKDTSKIVPAVAESWTVSEDGKTYTFKIRDGVKFHSGNPLTAEDAAFSLQRAVKLNKSPAFILTQFGFTKDNVDQKIKAADARTLVMETDKAYAPTFVLNCLTADVASVVDAKLLKQNEKDGDFGYGWLKTNSAGSGAFKLRQWKANESLTLDANPAYWQGAPEMKRVILRHIAEPATQRLLLEKGGGGGARDLKPEQLDALRSSKDVRIVEAPKGTLWYISLNQKNPILAKPEVRQAFRYLVDYDAMGRTIMNGIATIHQSFLPKGFLGSLDEKPFKYDPAKARELLTAAGYPDGFTVTMDVRNVTPWTDLAQTIQASAAAAGVKIELLPMDGKQALTKYRSRNQDIYLGQWGADYQDPHTNAETFASNPDNADNGPSKTLAWRNSWDIPELTQKTKAAVVERDAAKRVEIYHELQKTVMNESPFVVMFQQVEVPVERAGVKGLIWGPSFDNNLYRLASKK
jgi:peptide/nickel transport system substrate-binding protein